MMVGACYVCGDTTPEREPWSMCRGCREDTHDAAEEQRERLDEEERRREDEREGMYR